MRKQQMDIAILNWYGILRAIQERGVIRRMATPLLKGLKRLCCAEPAQTFAGLLNKVAKALTAAKGNFSVDFLQVRNPMLSPSSLWCISTSCLPHAWITGCDLL